MTAVRRSVAVAATALVSVALAAAPALAQSKIDATTVPEKNTGGWVYGMAVLVAILAAVTVIFLVAMYMRYAPRFSKDEDTKAVRADRVLPGKEPPRRTVDLSQAVPIVVQPPAVPAAVAAVAVAAPAAAPVSAPAPAAEAPAAPAPAAQAPPAEAPPAEAPPTEAPPAEALPAEAPAVEAPAVEAPAAPAPAPAAPEERHEVTMDQEVFEKTLEELLAKGTDRRVAEGQARRAGMIAARKKAEGEG